MTENDYMLAGNLKALRLMQMITSQLVSSTKEEILISERTELYNLPEQMIRRCHGKLGRLGLKDEKSHD